MVKKRLSKEYMELLRRNQNSVMTVGLAHPCLVLSPPHQEDRDEEHPDHVDDEPQGYETTVLAEKINFGKQNNKDETTVLAEQNSLDKENNKHETTVLLTEKINFEKETIRDGSCNEPEPEVEQIQNYDTEAEVDKFIDLENPQEKETEILGENVSEETDSDKRNMIKAYLRRSLQTERQEAKLPTPTRRRRREVSYPVTSSSYERLMSIVRAERDKHRQMINMVNNTSFTLSRRPLVTKSKYLEKRKRFKFGTNLDQEDEEASKDKRNKSAEKILEGELDVKSSRSVHFGTMVTFDDNSTPVPIRPPRKKTLRIPAWIKRSRFRGYKTTTPTVSLRRKIFQRKIQESDEDLGEAPEKPARIYKSRGATPVTEALRPIVRHQYQSSLDNIRFLIKSYNRNSSSKKSSGRSTLSSLNLFLSLVYEKLKDPGFLVDNTKSQAPGCMILYEDRVSVDSQDRICMHDKIAFHPCDQQSVPSAYQQLKDGNMNKIYLKNIPTLLLFNFIYGRKI